MAFSLPNLPYAMDALAPHISKETLEYHYGKHHQAYVNNLNNLLPGSGFEHKTLEDIVIEAQGGLFNNAAQIWNHSFYWHCLSPETDQKPQGALLQLIEQSFGSFAEFETSFITAAKTLFGSGWTWLIQEESGKLAIVNASNAGTPLSDGHRPLLTCDVWEHAYYIDTRNDRPKYLGNFWRLVNWRFVEENLKEK